MAEDDQAGLGTDDSEEPDDAGSQSDEVEWEREREWAWPDWVQGLSWLRWSRWQPDGRTFGAALLLLFGPPFFESLWELRLYVSRLIPPGPDPNQPFQLFPSVATWERVTAGTIVVLSAVDLALMVGGALLVAGRRRWGSRISVGALVVDTLCHVVFLMADFAEGRVPTAVTVGAISSIASRVLLLGVAILLLRGAPPAPAALEVESAAAAP